MNMEGYQLEWVLKHLGHSHRVHFEHYRQLSSYIERVHIGKLMLIQDMNAMQKYAGQKLEDVDITDLVREADQEIPDTVPPDIPVVFSMEDDATVPQGDDTFEITEEDESDEEVKTRTKKVNRHKWTAGEEEELKRYFKSHLETGTTPGKKETLKVMKISATKKAQLCKRGWHHIIKKISAMNAKNRKKKQQ